MTRTGAPVATNPPLAVVSFGEAIGYFINTLLSSGRQAMKLVLNTIIPFMAYVSLLIGINDTWHLCFPKNGSQNLFCLFPG